MPSKLVTPVSEEFAAADLGDKRLTRRLQEIASAAERSPGSSLPQRAGSSARLEATYRFFSNAKVTPNAVLGCHAQATLARAAAEPEVLVIHDTTEFRFGGETPREGLGWLNSDSKDGFLGHFSFCASREGRPLGTLSLHAWVRQGPRLGRLRKQRTPALRNPDRESQRWHEAALLTGELLNERKKAIHIMDREADQFELFALLQEHDQRFVVRVSHDRRLEGGRGYTGNPRLFESLSECPFFFKREVSVSARGKPKGTNKTQVFPARRSRTACLEVRAGTREVYAMHSAPAHVPKSLRLQVVEVREVNPPKGEAPIIWRLLTTEPAKTEQQVAAIVDNYRQRWLVEEFFKALKTGCRYQQLQLESIHALLVALSVEMAVAWRLLLLRWVAQHHSGAPATSVLNPEHFQVLAALANAEGGRRTRTKPTVRSALYALARLGGHIVNNGAPGWLVLRRGFEQLLTIHRGWALAQGP